MSAHPLADEQYVSLETFKRDGTGVRTPVWCAGLDDRVVIFTEGTSWKVKRLRRNPAVRLAPCDVRGRVRGDWHEGTGEVVEDPDRERAAYAALRRKYGWQMRLIDLASTLGGRIGRRKVLEIRLPE